MQKLILIIVSIFSLIAAANSALISKRFLRAPIKAITSIFTGSALLTSLPAQADFGATPWSPNIQYEVVKSAPNGDVPKIGELVAIRFKGSFRGNVFDDTFSTDQPYFYRVGVGSILKGLDDTVTNMHVSYI